MVGLIYFLWMISCGVVFFFNQRETREKFRDEFFKHGRMDYRDPWRRHWYGDKRCDLVLEDWHEKLVDKRNPNIVYMDYTQQKIDNCKSKLSGTIERDVNAKEKAVNNYCGAYLCSDLKTWFDLTNGEYFKILTFKGGVRFRVKRKCITNEYGINKYEDEYNGSVDYHKLSDDEYKFLTGRDCDVSWRKQYIQNHDLESIYNI